MVLSHGIIVGICKQSEMVKQTNVCGTACRVICLGVGYRCAFQVDFQSVFVN